METELNAQTLRANEKKFLEYNSLKLNVSNRLLTEKQKNVLHLIPFLLHNNIKGMPGYIETKNPVCGIANYKTDENLIRYASNKFGLSSPKIADINKPVIESLSLMGSIGSIAQNDKSDFDFWLCYFSDDIPAEELEILHRKIKLVEQWSAENKVETHFFPMDIKKIYSNNFGSAGGESCGSAQAALLKDEYFRSSIMIAGKTPLWWVFPEQSSEKLNIALWKKLKEENPDLGESFINIGNIDKVGEQEFFGAALWQLVKSLDSPYKSFIKMSLLEKYINSGSNVTLLSDKLKKTIWSESSVDFRKVDQYILMFNTISDYFENKNLNDVLNILRECFYLKVQPELSFKKEKDIEEDVKAGVMTEYCEKWRWNRDKIEFLDSFQKWTMTELIKFDSEIKKYMINNYVKISNVLKTKNISAIISDYDMTIIGRKLVSYYSKKPAKVEYFYFSLQDNFFEENINLIDTGLSWIVTRSKISGRFNAQSTEGTIYQSKYLSDICVWLAYNNIYNEWQTQLKLFTSQAVDFNNIRSFLHELQKLLKTKDEICKNPQFYIGDSFIVKCALTVNFDAVSDNKLDIMFMYRTSWGELFIDHYTSYKELYKKLKDVFASYKKLAHLLEFDEFFSFYVPKGNMNLCIPVKRLIEQAYSFFFKNKWFGSEQKIFITFSEGEYFAYSNLRYDFTITNTTSMVELFESFFAYKNHLIFYEYDRNILNSGIYSAIFSKLEADKNQFFIFDSGKYYLWLFFDSFNLPAVGAVQYSKLNETLEAMSNFVKYNCGKSAQMYELKKNVDNNYTVAEYRLKTNTGKLEFYNFAVEFNYLNDSDISNSAKFSIIVENMKFDLSEKMQFVEFLRFCYSNLQGKYFNIDSLKLINDKTENYQAAVYVRVKHKFERFIFSNLQLLVQLKKH